MLETRTKHLKRLKSNSEFRYSGCHSTPTAYLCSIDSIASTMPSGAIPDTIKPLPKVLIACGTASTLCGQLVSYPLTLVRTRLQAQEVPMNSIDRDTMTKLLIRIWRNEGIRGLYRGILPNIIKVVPAVSMSYVVYENIKKSLIDPVKTKSNNYRI